MNRLLKALTLAKINSFDEAVKTLNTLKNEPDNSIKLQIYGLYKQSTVGDCNTEKPSSVQFVNLVKWESWNSYKNLSKEEAQSKYIEIVQTLADFED